MRKFILLLAVLFIAGVFSIAFVKRYANQFTFSKVVNTPQAPAAIIFGAGYKHNGEPSKYLKDRLDIGIELFKAGRVKVLLLSGDNGSQNHDELGIMKKYCASQGIDTTKIFIDYAGFDTYSTLYRAKHIFQIDNAILISQNYHLDRAVFTGRMLGITSYGLSANKGSYTSYRKNTVREYAAIINALLELAVHRKPKFLGKVVSINGPSNFTKEAPEKATP